MYQALSPASRAHSLFLMGILGLRSQSLAAPQALCWRPLRGLNGDWDPGVALAKPRCTPGFMLTPASRARSLFLMGILGLRSQSLAAPQALRWRPLRGLIRFFWWDPGVALAKPRCTPGFMLTPASRAS